MAAILQMAFSIAFSWMKILYFYSKFVPKCPIDNKSALVQVIAWCQTGNKPLPEPMLTQLNNAYTALVWEMN